MDGTATHTRAEDVIQTPFVFFDENCEQSAEEAHPTFPPTSGTSILWDEAGGYFWQVRTQPDDFTLLFQLYGAWMVPGDRSVTVDTLVPEDHTTRWPQGSLVVGDYYIIASCEDPDGDLVSVSLNNQPVTTGVSSATAGLLVNIDEDSSATQTITIDWSDGTTNLQTSITLEVEEESSSSTSIIPGFQLILAVICLSGAALIGRKND